MSPKSYLEQARHLDIQISAKLRQMDVLKHDIERAMNADADIESLIALQHDINADIDALVETKRSIMQLISAVPNPDHRTLLELRYLCMDTWEAIADTMHYDVRWVHKLHGRALQEVACLIDGGRAPGMLWRSPEKTAPLISADNPFYVPTPPESPTPV